MKLWIDPPSGWKYGFPKVWDKELHPDFNAWIIAEGYPLQDLRKYFGKHFYVRQWKFSEGEESK